MADEPSAPVRVEQSGDVRLVTLDRPERRNALDVEALDLLMVHVDAAAEAGARVVVITGSGGHFCSGADLGGGGGPSEGPAYVARLNTALKVVSRCPVPVIAAVEGAALGAGLQLAAACDLRMVAPDSRLGVPAGKLGVVLDLDGVRSLAVALGDGPTRAMLLAAQTYSGEELHRLGFAQRLGSTAEALTWAEEIASLAPLTLRGHKVGLSPDVHHGSYRSAFEAAWGSKDLAEGTAAFRERRSPRFTGS